MKCPLCDGKTKVLGSRLLDEKGMKRNRKCEPCNVRFTSYELEDGRMAELLDMERAFKKMKVLVGEYQ